MKYLKLFEEFKPTIKHDYDKNPKWIEGMNLCKELEKYKNSPNPMKFNEIKDESFKSRVDKYFQENTLGDPNDYHVWEVEDTINKCCQRISGLSNIPNSTLAPIG